MPLLLPLVSFSTPIMNKPPDPGGFVSSSREFCSSRLLLSPGFMFSWPDSGKFLHRHLVGPLIFHPAATIFRNYAAFCLWPPACLFLADHHKMGLSRRWRCSVLLHQCLNCTFQVSSLSLLSLISIFPVALVGLFLVSGRFRFRVWVVWCYDWFSIGHLLL